MLSAAFGSPACARRLWPAALPSTTQDFVDAVRMAQRAAGGSSAARPAVPGFPPSGRSPTGPRMISRPLRREKDVHGATLVLDSEGGSVVDTLALGRALRTTRHHHDGRHDGDRHGSRRRHHDATLAGGRLRIDVRLRSSGRHAPLRSAASPHSGAPDLALQEARASGERRATPPMRSCWSSATSAAWPATRSRWAAGSSFWRRPCGCRHGSRCISCPATRSRASRLSNVDHLFDGRTRASPQRGARHRGDGITEP